MLTPSVRDTGDEKMPDAESRSDRILTRRDFVRDLAVGGSAIAVMGQFRLLHAGEAQGGTIRGILVDYDKCAGCRTCEAACASSNHQEIVDGESLPGLGNPSLANIRVHHYNPDVDVAAVCAMCPDAPCIEACPVPSDPATGRKALYRDGDTFAISNDAARCVGCGGCAEACEAERVGVITPHPESNQPERMCTLCDGDPQCVKSCPFGALSFVDVDAGREFHGKSPDAVAGELSERLYGTNLSTAVSAEETSSVLPQQTVLLPAYPNPANASVWIPYELGSTAEVTICIRNVLGQTVREMRVGHRAAGLHRVHWDGRSDDGAAVSSGVYSYSLHTETFVATRRVTLLK